MPDSAEGLPWGTQWDLAWAADDGVDWAAFLVTLGLQDGRAGGRAPVNRYFGMCREGPSAALELGPFGMTMMAGPPAAMTAESVFLRLLEQVRAYEVGEGTLTLLDSAGEPVLSFVPSADPE